MRILNAGMCFGGCVVLICLMLSFGCEGRPFAWPASDGGTLNTTFPTSLYGLRPEADDQGALPGWRPRTHPPGTLLLDGEGDYWIVDNWLERVRVPAEAMTDMRLDTADAIPMTENEERCLLPAEHAWRGGTRIEGWRQMIGPDHEEWLVHSGDELKRRAGRETLRSWGFGVMIDSFDGREEEWNRLREVDPPPFRDGYLLRTERGISYFVDGERWLFASEVLAAEAGYNLEGIRTVSESAILGMPVFGTFTREVFTICPAETPLAEFRDFDHDGSPYHRDCHDNESRIGEGFPEVCDGRDNDCDGIVDDPFPIGMPCEFTLHHCRLEGTERCLADRTGAYCHAVRRICDG